MALSRQTGMKVRVMTVGSAKTGRKALAMLAVAFVAALIFAPFVSVKAANISSARSEYQQFVQTYMNSTRGNWTSVGKPMFPVYFNESQIRIGSNWSIVEPLLAGHNYHVYDFGAWVNNGSSPKTDYDIYVYNPKGVLESEHTEAAGLPEHLGTRVNDTFFTPATSGNYTFVIVNDARESNGTQQATFMAIENVETDKWFTSSIEGKKSNGASTFKTSWAYEFVTNKTQIEVYLKVPDTLDMYEARLYVMSNPASLVINDAPLPWEPGLYGNLTGNLTGNVGGYNLNSDNYRGVAYASCEYKGQDMYLNYNSTSTNSTLSNPAPTTATPTNSTSNGKTLYHLVLIGEDGSGDVSFLVKTRFGDASLLPSTSLKNLGKVYAGNETAVAYTSNSTDLTIAVLNYTVDSWNSTKQIAMKIENRTCSTVIPKQKAGTVVEYKVFANDTLMNVLSAEGNFTVKQYATLNITAVNEKVHVGENVTIQGTMKGANGSVPVTVQFMGINETQNLEARTLPNGTFTVNFPTNSTGAWVVQASFAEDEATYPCYSNQLFVKVEEQPFYVKNGIFIGGGGFFGVIAVGLVYYIRKRRV